MGRRLLDSTQRFVFGDVEAGLGLNYIGNFDNIKTLTCANNTQNSTGTAGVSIIPRVTSFQSIHAFIEVDCGLF